MYQFMGYGTTIDVKTQDKTHFLNIYKFDVYVHVNGQLYHVSTLHLLVHSLRRLDIN
jgi:hypothetical protein